MNVAKEKMIAQSEDITDINEQMEQKTTSKSEKKKPFKLLNNSITKLLNEADMNKLKLIYNTEG